MLTQTMLTPARKGRMVLLTKSQPILFLSLQVFRAFYSHEYIVKQSSPNVLLLFQLPRCCRNHRLQSSSELLKYANCGQGLQILGLKYAIYGQLFRSFWASNMLISGQTLAGASRGLYLCSHRISAIMSELCSGFFFGLRSHILCASV